MSEDLNIYQKLSKVRKQVEVMKKDTKAYGYSYVKEEDILARITGAMDKHHLSLIPRIVPSTLNIQPYSYKKTKSTRDGNIYEENANEVLVSADLVYTWINDDNPEEQVVVPWGMVGQQTDASQSFGSGLTYSSRYFLLKYFNVSTSNDDPDKWRSKQKQAEEEQAKMVASEIINQVDSAVRSHLSIDPNKAGDIKNFMTGYVKSGNYFTITDPILAQKLLEDFTNKFSITNNKKEKGDK